MLSKFSRLCLAVMFLALAVNLWVHVLGMPVARVGEINPVKADFPGWHINETRVIQLQPATDPTGIIVYEDDQVRISMSPDQFKAYRDSVSPKRWPLSDNDLAEIRMALKIGALPEENGSRYALVSELLKSGQASVYDKRTASELQSIVMHYKDQLWCPRCGGGSIAFYFSDGSLLYQGPEWRY